MTTKKTDRTLLSKGIRVMLICLLLLFAGPSLVYISLSNDEKPLFIPLLILAFLLCVLAVFFLFKGINTIMDSIFGKRKQ